MMKKLIFILPLLLITSASFATQYRVQDGRNVVHIKTSKKKISFKHKRFAKTIKRKKCNRFVFDLFKSHLQKNEKELTVFNGSKKGFEPLVVSVGSKSKMALRYSKAGQYFSRLPSSIRNLYFTSKEVCEK